MYFERFLNDDANIVNLQRAVNSLDNIHFFAVLMELGARRSEAQPTDKPIENAALRAAWHNGYMEAIFDLANFNTRYVQDQTKKMPPADFGALDELVRTKEITEEERDRIRSGKSPAIS